MLILERTIERGVRIGDAIHIKVLKIRGKYVRLGIDAPADVAVWRDEKPRSASPPASTTAEAPACDTSGRIASPEHEDYPSLTLSEIEPKAGRMSLAPSPDAPANDDHADASQYASSLTVLMVEDDPDHAALIDLCLRDHGVRKIDHATSRDDAINALVGARASDSPPDLLLLDYHLGDDTALDVIRTIRAHNALRFLPIVMLSVNSNDNDINECIDAGANAFIQKPGTFDEMRRAMGLIVGFWSSARRVG